MCRNVADSAKKTAALSPAPGAALTQAGQTRLPGADLYSTFMTEFMPKVFPLTSPTQTKLLPALTHRADASTRL